MHSTPTENGRSPEGHVEFETADLTKPLHREGDCLGDFPRMPASRGKQAKIAKSNDWRTTPKPDALRAYKPPGQRHPKQPFSQNKQPFQADRVPYFASWQELSIILSGLPLSWGTAEVYNLLSQHGSEPTRIDMVPEYSKAGNAKTAKRTFAVFAFFLFCFA